jgi:cyclic-di-GMP phosphodiesterase, flagellum assembly factor TipF
MIRLSALFVAVCMVLIAGSFGGVLYLAFGMTGAEAAVVALAALTGLAVYHAVSTRIRYQSELSGQLGDLSRGTADLARQVGEQARRLATLEKNSESAVQKAIAVSQPLQTEISELGALLKQLAQSVAAQESAVRALASQQSSATLVPDSGHAPAPVGLLGQDGGTASHITLPMSGGNGPFRGMESAAVAELVRAAISDNRIEIYLQPIVTLPQRKVRYYEALMRLRLPDERIVAAGDFLAHAEAAGLMPSLDYFVIGRCVRILRRLQSKNRDVGVFCNISAETLADRDMFAQIGDFAEANRVLAPVLIFELPYAALRAAGAQENERLSKLTDMGFRLSVDHVPDLRFDARDLADRKCGFLKIATSVLLDRNSQAAADIHPADIAGLLARNGIELIAEKVEAEETVVDLLDFDVKTGQGNLFSPPRPVKPDGKSGDSDAIEDQPAPAPHLPVAEGIPQPQPAASSALARLARVVSRH